MPIFHLRLENHQTVELHHDSPRPTSPRGPVWLDICTPTEDDLAWLERTYHFHPLTIEDIRNFNQRAKVEAYDHIYPDDKSIDPDIDRTGRDQSHDYLFISLSAAVRENGDLDARELEAFLGPDYLITVHREPLRAIDDVRLHFGARDRRAPLGPDFILYLVADHMVDAYFPLLDEMEDEIDTLEDKILENATRETLHHIFELKQQLVFLRKLAAPMRDVMNALASTRYGLVDEHTALYFRDAFDHLTRIYDLVETSRDLLGNSLDAYLSNVSNRLNEVMKRLTLIATIFMPISFLAGLGGMNFQQIPFDNPIAFSILLLAILLVPTGMLIWFWHSRWM
jgi:magnesium transporter